MPSALHRTTWAFAFLFAWLASVLPVYWASISYTTLAGVASRHSTEVIGGTPCGQKKHHGVGAGLYRTVMGTLAVARLRMGRMAQSAHAVVLGRTRSLRGLHFCAHHGDASSQQSELDCGSTDSMLTVAMVSHVLFGAGREFPAAEQRAGRTPWRRGGRHCRSWSPQPSSKPPSRSTDPL